MKKAKNKLLLMFFVIVLTASGIIGCKSDESKPTESQTDISDNKGQEMEKESETNRLSDYPEGTFDGEEVCKRIEINGKVVEFPWTLNKLGDEYEFEDVIINDNTYMAKLMYNGEYMFDVIGIKKEVDRDTPIVYVFFSRYDNVKICEIDGSYNIFDVERTFGQPYKKSSDAVAHTYVYRTKDVQVIFMFNYNNEVISFGISTTGEWNIEEE